MLLGTICTTAVCQAASVNHASAGITTLQQWYNKSTGLWDSTGWWNSANALTALADFSAIDPALDSISYPVFENTFKQAQAADINVAKVMTANLTKSYTWPHNPLQYPTASKMSFPGFLNQYYDDEGWWALAWLKVYDITNQTRYLTTAASIFEDMTTGWGAPCGGLWWDKAHTYSGAIENELFLTVAAQLANRAPLLTKQYYLDWALKEWGWFERSGMINPQLNVNNGLDLKTCQNDNGTVWSYNQGVILGGLIELNRAAPNDLYLATAAKIALAAIEHLSDSNGILHEPCEPNCGADGPQFKGIFMRNLGILQNTLKIERISEFLQQNAESIWHNDRGDENQLGLIWSGPFIGATASTQSSACDALIAALAGNLTHRLAPSTKLSQVS